jgi:NarL family two-component system sensor histidine kinase LiaS
MLHFYMAKIHRLAFIFIVGYCLLFGSSGYAQDSGAKSEFVQNKPSKSFVSDTILIHKYIKLASSNLYYDAGKAVLYSQQILRLAQKHQWAKGKIIAYDLLSTYYLIDGSYDILRQISNEILILSQKENLPLYTANARRFLGI